MDTVMKIFIGHVVALLFLCLVVALVQAKEVVVLTSTLHIADFTRQVAGERLRVVSLLDSGVDPHLYLPSPQDVEDIAGADLCLDNGLNLENNDWLRTSAEMVGTPVVTVTKGIKPLMIQEGDTLYVDPHAWLSPKNVSVYISNIVAELSQLMPEYKEEFTLRAALYMHQIRALDVWTREQVHRLRPEKRNLITSHAAWGYFCREYGFNSSAQFQTIAPIGWSTGQGAGAESTPTRMSRVVEFYVQSGGSPLFPESTVDDQYLRVIAKETGGHIGGRLFSDSMAQPHSADGSYIAMMRENVLTITRGLKK